MIEAADDADLLRRYAADRDEAAFAELVRRHLDLVHSAALRQLNGDAHLAQDATQLVFVDLARKAAALARHRVLAGWLFTSTRFAAAKLVRTERRRVARETHAHTMLSADADSNRHGNTPSAAGLDAHADWDRVRPVLDAALADLAATEREMILLRFFEGRDFADIGARLSLTANAARMRVDRALDKLHARLVRRGVTSTPAALALALGAQAVAASPAGLAVSVTGAALAASGTATLSASAFSFLAFMKTSHALLGLASLAAVGSLGVAFVAVTSAREADSALAVAVTASTSARAHLADLETRAQSARQRVQQAELENARLLVLARAHPATLPAEAKEEVVTSAGVTARIERATALIQSGSLAEALHELIWCYDVGTPRLNMGAVLRFKVVKVWADLARKHPAARMALEDRRERARLLMLSEKQDADAATDYGRINEELQESAQTLALMDQLAAGDARRQRLANQARAYLVEVRRYADAAEGFTSTWQIVSGAVAADPIARSKVPREDIDYVFQEAGKHIEALAGLGQAAPAGELIERLLNLDGSEAARARLRQHLTRAGASPERFGLSSR